LRVLPGQYFDAETQTHYNYFRDYDPSIGRFVESDPLGLAAGLSTFGYAWGRPLGVIDPLGLDPNNMCVAACTMAGVMAGGMLGEALGGIAGGAVGVALGTAGGPPGMAIGGASGASLGGAAGGAAGAAAGGAAGNAAGQALCPQSECNPPKGTVCFFIDLVPPSKPHYPIPGSHYHLYQMNQAPSGKCFWNSLGASATAPPGAIPCPFERTPTR
jgi:RHS repeat-associated protein